MKQRILLALLILGLIGFVGVGVRSVVHTREKVQLQDVQLQNRSTQIKQLQLKYKVLNTDLDNQLKQTDVNQQKVQELEQQKAELEKQTQDLQAQLQAKRNAQSPVAAAASKVANAIAPTAYAVTGCGDDANMAFIYQHESGCSTGAINASSGACGLGQALPCSKIGCSLSDWACQDAFFRNYAIARYGSTGAAVAFWQAHSWW